MRTALFLLFLIAAPAAAFDLYTDEPDNGFAEYYSWAADFNFANPSPVHAGTHSIRFKPDNWGGIRIKRSASPLRLADYSTLTFWIYGDSTKPGGQRINLFLERSRAGNNPQPPTIKIAEIDDIGSHAAGGAIASGAWRQVTIDLAAAGLTFEDFDILYFLADSSINATQPAVFIDDMALAVRGGAIPNGGTITATIDADTVLHPIDPRIFGVAYGDPARNAQMGYTVRRWGGNSTSRYNWQTDFHNTGSDYYFENIPDCETNCTGTPPAGNSADAFITQARNGGALPLITIPTIGWTPRADSAKQHPFTVGFAVSKYGTQDSVDPYDTNAGNGVHGGAFITGNTPADSSTAITSTFEKQWIAHLQSTFGTAAAGGVKLFALDNEVMLWNSTHRDVHPSPPTYDEILNKTLDYAAVIKTQEPDALVTGPVTWGYPDLFTSAADAASCNCFEGSDRSNHGGTPFVAWWLQQVCANPLAGGKRLVDFLDLHYYPQGDAGEDDSPAAAAPRTRAVKELYDANWVSESWIGGVDGNEGDIHDPYHYTKPGLFPRVRAWIDQYCAGTKLLISEYDWGADDLVSSGVVQAEALAIYAREGLDMATRWVAPASGSYSERGFSIFLNYDGAGAKVQGDAVAASSSNVDQVGAYAFRQNGQRVMILLTNKDTLIHDVQVSFAAPRSGTWHLYGFDAVNEMHAKGSGAIAGSTLTVPGLLPMSATLLVLPDNDDIFKNGFDTGG